MAKTIVITGSGGGLGRALARRFAGDGETVVVLGRTLSKIEKVADELGAPAFPVQCDVASPDSVRAAFAAIAERHPKIDVLINNAAIYEPFLLKDATDEQILDPLLINFGGPIFCTRAAIPMLEKGGHIINVSSESVKAPFPMFCLYQSTKAGLERFSESMQKELENDGVRVTTVRAGQMMDQDSSTRWDPDVAKRFAEECQKAGINLMARPITQFVSVTDIFRILIDLPADLHATTVLLEARHA